MQLFQNCILLDIPLDPLFFTSFVVLLTDNIFSTMFASSSGGSCEEKEQVVQISIKTKYSQKVPTYLKLLIAH